MNTIEPEEEKRSTSSSSRNEMAGFELSATDREFLSQAEIVTRDPRSDITAKFMKYEAIAAPAIRSFNQALLEYQQMVNDSILVLKNGDEITFTDTVVLKPSMIDITQDPGPRLPQLCRLEGRNYTGNVMTTAHWKDKEAPISLGDMPIMLMSQACNLNGLDRAQLIEARECPNDPYGYFVVGGAEKIIVMQERAAPNKIMTYQDPQDDQIATEIKCVAADGRKIKVGVRLMKKEDDDISDAKRTKITKNVLKVGLSFFDEAEINICAVFEVMGAMYHEDPEFFANPSNIQAYILDWVEEGDRRVVADYLDQTMEAYIGFHGNANGYISRKLKLASKGIPEEDIPEYIAEHIDNSLFVNMIDDPPDKRIEMLALLVARFITVVTGIRGRRINPIETDGVRDLDVLIQKGLDDRDDYGNKILDTPGSLLGFLISQAWKKQAMDVTADLNESLNQPNMLSELANHMPKHLVVKEVLIKSIRTGNWGMPNKTQHTGISRTLQRASLVGAIADVRSVNAPIPRESHDIRPRSVHLTYWGFICPTSTREGEDCLSLDTEILTADGTTVALERVQNREVSTVNESSLEVENSGVKNYFEYEASTKEKQMYRITTITGRSIRATQDHPFLTSEGWKRVDDLDADNDMLTCQHFYDPLPPHAENRPYEILSVEQFRSILTDAGAKDSLISANIETLPLPLMSHFPKLHILARIFGIMITDGGVGVSSGAVSSGVKFGRQCDSEAYVQDLIALGFSEVKISEVDTQVTDKETGRVTKHHCFSVQKGGAFARFMIAIGAPFGCRTEKEAVVIPDWIMKGSPLVKREFLGGVMGGDGCKIGFAKRPGKPKAYNIEISPFGQHKAIEHVSSLRSWMMQFKDLLSEFGVETFEVTEKHDYDDKVKVALPFSRAADNLVRFMKQIGYRYASTKQNQGFLVCEYLLYKESKINERISLKKRVFELLNGGMRPYAIARELGTTGTKIVSIVSMGPDAATLAPKDTLTIAQFQEMTLTSSPSHLRIPIKSIDEISSEMVGDFTTVGSNHSFVANGFVVHNCGLAKSLAQGASVSLHQSHLIIDDFLEPYISHQRVIFEEGSDSILLPPEEQRTTAVLVNGRFKGWCNRDELRSDFINARRDGVSDARAIPVDASINGDLDGMIQIHSTEGRLIRPVLVVNYATQVLVIDEKGLWDADWNTLLINGAAEYLDSAEQGDALIAISPSDLGVAVRGPGPNEEVTYEQARDPNYMHIPLYTHVELDPALLFSYEANVAPFPQMNPGTRITYESNMAKHAVGITSAAYQGIPANTEDPAVPGRFEGAKIIAYPQRPLVGTDVYERSELPSALSSASAIEAIAKLHLTMSPEEIEMVKRRISNAKSVDLFGATGQNATVAILSSNPASYNEEDSMMISKRFIDNGGFMTTTYKADSYEIENPNIEKRGIPPNVSEDDQPFYAAIDPKTGVARPGSVLRPGMAILAKYTEEAGVVRNTSIFLKDVDSLTPAEILKPGSYVTREGKKVVSERKVRSVLSTSISNEPIMDEYLVGQNGNGKTYIKWKYRITRRPQVGDKFASRFSQKGVVGMIFYPEDMPFSASGITPDIIINPHAFPSRMTIGQLIESLTGKAGALLGTRINGTAFREVDHATLARVLGIFGFSSSGAEVLYDGATGVQLKAMVFQGPVFYQVLKHMVEEKKHGRARGDVHHLYRQPPEGWPRKLGLPQSEQNLRLVRRYASNIRKLRETPIVNLIRAG
jgi:DNA-directed RNA polymerase beta subunit